MWCHHTEEKQIRYFYIVFHEHNEITTKISVIKLNFLKGLYLRLGSNTTKITKFIHIFSLSWDSEIIFSWSLWIHELYRTSLFSRLLSEIPEFAQRPQELQGLVCILLLLAYLGQGVVHLLLQGLLLYDGNSNQSWINQSLKGNSGPKFWYVKRKRQISLQNHAKMLNIG